MLLSVLNTVMLLGTNPVERAKEVTRVFLTPFTYIAWLIVACLVLELYLRVVSPGGGDDGSRGLGNDVVVTAVQSFWYAFASLVWIPIIDAGRGRITAAAARLLTMAPRRGITVVDAATVLLVLSLYFDVRFYVNGSLVCLLCNWVSHRCVPVADASLGGAAAVEITAGHVRRLQERIPELLHGVELPNLKIRRKLRRLMDSREGQVTVTPVTVEAKTDDGTVGNESTGRPLVRIYDEIGNVRALNNKGFRRCTVRTEDGWGVVEGGALHGNSIVTCHYDRSKAASTFLVESAHELFLLDTADDATSVAAGEDS